MYQIKNIGIKGALELIIPEMIKAGGLAKKLQAIITIGSGQGIMVKEGHRFGSVLTDADILVETMIGCFLYTTFEDAGFYGEEADKDRISAYFPKDAPYEVTLDPINGTLFYRDGLRIWDMILTIRQSGRFVAVVDYLPHSGVFYIGIEGKGAFKITDEDIRFGRSWNAYSLGEALRIVFTQRSSREQEQRLRDAGFAVVELERDYQPSPDWRLATKSILTGEASGYVKSAAHFIDWGALGWLASLAGGQWNDPTFDSVTGRGSVVAAVSPFLYAELMTALGK